MAVTECLSALNHQGSGCWTHGAGSGLDAWKAGIQVPGL